MQFRDLKKKKKKRKVVMSTLLKLGERIITAK